LGQPCEFVKQWSTSPQVARDDCTKMGLSDGMYNIQSSTRQCPLCLPVTWNHLTQSIQTIFLFCWYTVPLLFVHPTLVWMQPSKKCEDGKDSQSKGAERLFVAAELWYAGSTRTWWTCCTGDRFNCWCNILLLH
jgi:hypothetical protein